MRIDTLINILQDLKREGIKEVELRNSEGNYKSSIDIDLSRYDSNTIIVS